MPENALLVLRSTVYPGVTKLVYDRLQASGRKLHLAFCPERIAEGKAMEEIRDLAANYLRVRSGIARARERVVLPLSMRI